MSASATSQAPLKTPASVMRIARQAVSDATSPSTTSRSQASIRPSTRTSRPTTSCRASTWPGAGAPPATPAGPADGFGSKPGISWRRGVGMMPLVAGASRRAPGCCPAASP